MLKKLSDVMVVILNAWFIEDESLCSGLSFRILVSSIVFEIKILLIDQMLHHFVCHPLLRMAYKESCFSARSYWHVISYSI
jgi:hypothetical protein